MDQSIFTRAMLVKLSISSWGATKDDKEAAAETAKVYGAKKDSGKYTKRLMPKGDNAFNRLKAHIGAMRITNYAQTLPWSDDGWRVLPIGNFHKHSDIMRDGFHTYETLLAELVTDYPALKAQAIEEASEEAIRTGNPRRLLSDSDFPADIRKEYAWEIDHKPVPSGGDFRVELSQDEIDILAAKTESRTMQAIAAAQSDAVNRLMKVVANIQENCADPKAIFRDTLIGNARELCDILTRLNVTGDPRLEEYRRQTELLAMSEPETLRKNPDVRAQVANEAQSILDAMTASFGGTMFGGAQ